MNHKKKGKEQSLAVLDATNFPQNQHAVIPDSSESLDVLTAEMNAFFDQLSDVLEARVRPYGIQIGNVEIRWRPVDDPERSLRKIRLARNLRNSVQPEG